tara:strand:- start:845 stop:1111 length:267 start_codon:yes stop_codon:yes gene_type:complete
MPVMERRRKEKKKEKKRKRKIQMERIRDRCFTLRETSLTTPISNEVRTCKSPPRTDTKYHRPEQKGSRNHCLSIAPPTTLDMKVVSVD